MPSPRVVGVDVQHLEDLVVLQRRKAQVLALDLNDERRHAGEELAEGVCVLGLLHPGEALVLVVVVLGQLLDRLRKEIAQRHRVGGEKRAEGVGGHCISSQGLSLGSIGPHKRSLEASGEMDPRHKAEDDNGWAMDGVTA